MRWKAIRIVTVVTVSGLALVAAGCGSSKKSSTPTTTTTTETTTTESTPTTTETTTTTEATTTTESTTASTNPFTGGKCKDLAQKAQNAMSAAGAKGDVGAAAQALSKVADQAPSEIKGDVQTIADVLQKYADALKSAGYTPGQVPSAAQATKIALAAKSLQGEQAKLTQAEQHITSWARKNCT